MKYLIDSVNRVIVKGEFVRAESVGGGFIYDTAIPKISFSKMEKIGMVNGFSIGENSPHQTNFYFNKGLSSLNIPEQVNMSTSEKVEEIVKAGLEEGLSEDKMLINIVLSGVDFKRAVKAMQTAMVSMGHSVSAKDRYERCKSIMDEDGFEPETWPEVVEMSKDIEEAIKGATNSQILGDIRKYCRENEISFPKRIKEKTVSLFILAMVHIIKNHDDGLEEFQEWMENKGFREKAAEGWTNNFIKISKEMEKTKEAA